MEVDYEYLTGDVLISSGVIAYLGAFTPTFRTTIVNDWAKEVASHAIPTAAVFNIIKVLGNPVEIR